MTFKRIVIAGGVFSLLLSGCSKNFSGPTPQIDSVSPSKGWTGVDNTIKIYGNGFSPVVKNTLEGSISVELPEVFLGTSPEPLTLTVIKVSQTEIDAVVPKGAPVGGPYSITVINPDEKSSTLPNAYEVTANPLIQVTKIYPNFGWKDEKTTVYISGSGFLSTPEAYLEIQSQRIKLLKVAFINSNSLSAVVPSDLPPGGPYNLVVINPDGDAGVLENAFTVTQNPPPYIDNVNPTSANIQQNVDVVISGNNFRQPKVVLIDASYNEVNCSININSFTSSEIKAKIPVSSCGIQTGVYLVRVINQDENSYYDWSAFAVTNPASNPGAWQPVSESSWLKKGRQGLSLVSGRNDMGQKFLYAIGGGDSGSGRGAPSQIYDDIEVSQLDPFGEVGEWRINPNRMKSKRFAFGAVQHNGWVYVIGGKAENTNEPITSCAVERAKILTSDTAPVIKSITYSQGGNLKKGAWYYRVSAVMKSTYSDNPGGETIASDEGIIAVPDNSKVTIEWEPPPSGGSEVAFYRVYRTDEPNGVSGTEHLIADNITTTIFTDDGKPAGTQSYVPNGGLGAFKCENQTGFTPRWGLSVVLGHDKNNNYYIYAIGGHDGSQATEIVQYAKINSDGSLGDWSNSSSISARYYLTSVFVDSKNAPVVGSNNYIYALGGTSNGITPLTDSQIAGIQTGGGLSSWSNLSKLIPQNMGLLSVAIDNFIFDICGTSAGGNKVVSAQIINSSGDVQNWNAAGNGAATVFSRFLGGTALESAYIYLVGGYGKCSSKLCTSPTTDEALRSVEKVIW